MSGWPSVVTWRKVQNRKNIKDIGSGDIPLEFLWERGYKFKTYRFCFSSLRYTIQKIFPKNVFFFNSLKTSLGVGVKHICDNTYSWDYSLMTYLNDLLTVFLFVHGVHYLTRCFQLQFSAILWGLGRLTTAIQWNYYYGDGSQTGGWWKLSKPPGCFGSRSKKILSGSESDPDIFYQILIFSIRPW